jgi:hypothetical protein
MVAVSPTSELLRINATELNSFSRSIGLLCYPTDNEADSECEREKEEDRA